MPRRPRCGDATAAAAAGAAASPARLNDVLYPWHTLSLQFDDPERQETLLTALGRSSDRKARLLMSKGGADIFFRAFPSLTSCSSDAIVVASLERINRQAILSLIPGECCHGVSHPLDAARVVC